MKFCKDCKKRVLVKTGWLHDRVSHCTHGSILDPVNGKPQKITCGFLRKNYSQCGPNAVWFEPK